MKLVFANGTELEVVQIMESILPRNKMEVPDGKILDIMVPENCSLSLEELAAMFTKEACENIQGVTDYDIVTYTGYTTLLSVSSIIEPAKSIRSVRLTQVQ